MEDHAAMQVSNSVGTNVVVQDSSWSTQHNQSDNQGEEFGARMGARKPRTGTGQNKLERKDNAMRENSMGYGLI